MANETQKKSSVVSKIAAVQVAVMLVLTFAMVVIVSSKTTANITNHCKTITKDKSTYIEEYIQNAETILLNYSCADEILNAVTNPTDEEYINAAQKYTEKVSMNIRNLEGIYVSEWNTNVLAHTNVKYTGSPTRSGEALDQLHDVLINSPNNLYDAGIIISPVSKSQIISMYKAVFNQIGQPVGLVGLGIYTSDIVDDLNKLESGMGKSSSYSMIDVNTGKYIFSSNTERINTEVSIDGIAELCNKLRGQNTNTDGTFTYTDNNKSYYSVYNYNGDRGWVFTVDGTHMELFSLTTSMVVFLIIFAALYIVIAVIFNRLGKKQEETLGKLETSLRKTEKTKESLNTAIFNDILTDCRNRISFSNDFESGKIKDSFDYPYFFIMFNIAEFSSINILYGEDTGDEILTHTAETIRRSLEGAQIYRTGSDEFVAVLQSQNNPAGHSRISELADRTLSNLNQQVGTSAGSISPVCRASIVKKSTNIDSSVLPALKDIMNQSLQAAPGQIPFMDMDNI